MTTRDPHDTDAEGDTQAPNTPGPTPSPPNATPVPPTSAAGGSAPATDPTLAADSVTPAATAAELPQVARTNYDVGAELARGGMGRILVARDRRIGRPVALKELLGGGGDGMLRRFEREALVTGRLQHPAIVPVYEAGRWPSGEPFYAMKLVSGKSLEKVINERPAFADRLALLPNVIHIAEAMAYAHSERVIHRDLKPANVLVGAYGETVVIDWGLAKDLRDTSAPDVDNAGPYRASASGALTVMGSVMGTPVYMPPEQASGDAVDERADVYALGAILYHVLTGRAPYTGKSAEHILTQVTSEPPPPIATYAPDVPDELATIVAKAMARAPGDRYRTAKELADELVRFQAGQLVSAHRYSAWALARRFVRRHRAAVIAAAALVVVAGVLGVVSVRQIMKARDRATAARDRVELERRKLLEQEGRQELAAGHGPRAAVFLAEAYALGSPSEALRTMLGEAMRPLDALVAELDVGSDVVRDASFAPTGDRFATWGEDGFVLWTADGKQIVRIAEAHDAPAWSPDGARLAVATDTTRLYDATTGAVVTTLAGAEDATTIVFSPDGARIYGLADKLISWDAKTGARLATGPRPHDGGDLRVSADGKRILAATEGQLTVVDAVTLAVIGQPVAVAAISGDGARTVTPVSSVEGAPADVLELHDPLDAKAIRSINTGTFDEARLDGHGAHLLTVSQHAVNETRYALWDTDGTLLAHASGGLAAMSANGTRLAIEQADGSIDIWSDNGLKLGTLPGHRRGMHALAFNPDGTRLVSVSEDGVRLWRVDDGAVRFVPGAVRVTEGAISPDGHRLLALDNTAVLIHELPSLAFVAQLPAAGPLLSAEWSPTGNRIVTTTSSGVITVWDAAGQAITTMPEVAYTAHFSPDGTRVVTAGNEEATIWDARTGAKVATLAGHGDLVATARWSPDGTRVLTACLDGIARVFDAGSGAAVAKLVGHAAYLVDARWDATGTRILTASGDGTARLWNAATGKRIATLGGHTSALRAASFNRDGTRIVTVSGDGARMWDAQGKLRATVNLHGLVDARFLGGGELIAFVNDFTLDVRTAGGEPILSVGVSDDIVSANTGVVPDPRAYSMISATPDGLTIVFGGRSIATRTLARETRDATEISDIVDRRSGWRVQDGGLVPSADPAIYRTDEMARVAVSNIMYDFSDDVISADITTPSFEAPVHLAAGELVPGVTVPADPKDVAKLLPAVRPWETRADASEETLERLAAVEAIAKDPAREGQILDRLIADHPKSERLTARRIRRAWLARATQNIAVVRKSIDGLEPLPAVPPELLYQLAWARLAVGDPAAAYRTLLAAATGWAPADTDVVKELCWFAAAAAIGADDVIPALALTRAAKGSDQATLYGMLIDAYRAAGEDELRAHAQERLVGIAGPAQIAEMRDAQAKDALAAGQPGELATAALLALAQVDDQVVPDDVHTAVLHHVIEYTVEAQGVYEKTHDERYARVARRLYAAVLAKPRGNPGLHDKLAEAALDLDLLVAHGPATKPTLDQTIIHRAIGSREGHFRRCYARALMKDPLVAGRVTLQIAIGIGGKIERVTPQIDKKSSDGLYEASSCMAKEAMHIEFPHMPYAPPVNTTYPFELRRD